MDEVENSERWKLKDELILQLREKVQDRQMITQEKAGQRGQTDMRVPNNYVIYHSPLLRGQAAQPIPDHSL